MDDWERPTDGSRRWEQDMQIEDRFERLLDPAVDIIAVLTKKNKKKTMIPFIWHFSEAEGSPVLLSG